MEDFTQEQIDLIKKTCVPANADPEHIKLFLYYAAKYGLDPLTKEIVLEIRTSKHGDKKAVIITTRDGYLKVSMKDPSYNGVNSGVVKEGDVFENDPVNGVLKHTFGEKRGKIIAGWAVAKAKDRDPIIVIADFDEYSNANNSSLVWRGYPSAMIQKVAEISAMKRQFNITGLVGAEEMATSVEITLDETPEVPVDTETGEIPGDVYVVVLIDPDPTANLKNKLYNVQAIVYKEGYDDPITLKVPQKFKNLLVGGAALRVKGDLKDKTLIATEVAPETGETEEPTQEPAKEPVQESDKKKTENIVTLTSHPKEVSIKYKGQDIVKPYATGEYLDYKKAFVIGDAVAPFMPGDVLEIKIADSEEKDGIIKLFVSEAKKIEQETA